MEGPTFEEMMKFEKERPTVSQPLFAMLPPQTDVQTAVDSIESEPSGIFDLQASDLEQFTNFEGIFANLEKSSS
jgi:hypothetical protein